MDEIIESTKDYPIKNVDIETALIHGLSCEIKTEESYKQLLKSRHDLCHYLIAKYNGFNYPEKKLSDYIEIKDENWNLIKDQTPDMIKLDGKIFTVWELTISESRYAERYKIGKYSLLCNILRRNGFVVKLRVIVLNTVEEEIEGVPIDCWKIIRNCESIITNLQSTTIGRSLILNTREQSVVDHGVSILDVLKEMKNCNACDDPSMLYNDEGPEITQNDEEFMDELSKLPNNVPNLFKEAKFDPNEFISYHNERSNCVSEDHVIVYPYKTLNETHSKDLGRFKDSTSYFRHFDEDTHTYNPRLTKEERSAIAKFGPGRKRFGLSNDGENDNKWFNIGVRTDDILNLINKFSDVRLINEQLEGQVIEYLRFIQKMAREASLNGLRDNKFFRWSWIDNTSILIIHSGSRLRSGESTSIIWCQILTYQSVKSPPGIRKWKKTDKQGVSQSGWFSLDVHRISHMLRLIDKVSMCYFGFVESLGSHNLVDKTNFFGTIVITYLENKRCTSSMIQDVRYIIMQATGLSRHWSDVISKFEVPLRSRLQTYFLQRILKYIDKVDEFDTDEMFSIGLMKGIDMEDDSKAGSTSLIPPCLIDGPRMHFKAILSEMYLCMLMNKDQDDPTHASFKIMLKILEGEQRYHRTKSLQLHQGYLKGLSDVDFAKAVIKEGVGFSSRAIMIGSKLQSMDSNCSMKYGLSHSIAATSGSLNKDLNQFATLKSSFVPSKTTIKVESRIKCIEAIHDLVEETGIIDQVSVYKTLKDNNVFFSLFKKNQIGGTREILILDIVSRIKINVLESLSRKICSFDGREMLTKGLQKNKVLRNLQTTVHKLRHQGFDAVYFNLDKSKWGPSFIPIQFAYMFVPFRAQLGVTFNTIIHTLLKHHQKVSHIPQHLIKIWQKDKEHKHKHTEKGLEDLRQKFEKDGSLYFHNESNMGQGILHFTSSYHHLCMLSFAKNLHKRMCAKMGIVNTGEFGELVSSDDSHITIYSHRGAGKRFWMIVRLFARAMDIAETLFNMKTSKVKSSVSRYIYEFNSTFGSSVSFYPVLMKFCLSSVDVPCTDDPSRMVSSMISNVRQLRENGASSWLCSRAHHFNRLFMEHIYPIRELCGYHNIIRLPFHLGCYPDISPELMELNPTMIHNKRMIQDFESLSDDEKKLFINSHSITLVDTLEVASGVLIDESDSHLVKIRCHTGPIRRLNTMRDNMSANIESLTNMMDNDPFILFRKAQNKEEILFKIRLLLFSQGVKESIRYTNACLYYARMAASRSSNCYTMNGVDDKLSNHLTTLITSPMDQDIKYIEEIFYSSIMDHKFHSTPQVYFDHRHPLQPMKYLTFQIADNKWNIRNPVIDVVQKVWNNENLSNSELRDWLLIKESNSSFTDSFKETLQNLKTTSNFLYKLRKIMQLKSQSVKWFAYGASTQQFIHTVEVLESENKYPDKHIRTEYSQLDTMIERLDDVRSVINLFVCSAYTGNEPDELQQELPWMKIAAGGEMSEYFKRLCLMYGVIWSTNFDLQEFMSHSKLVIKQWIKPQVWVSDRWVGDGSVVYQCHKTVLRVDVSDGWSYLSTKSEGSDDLKRCYDEYMRDFPEYKVEPGSWYMSESGLFRMHGSQGIKIRLDKSIFPILFTARPYVEFDDSKLKLKDFRGKTIISARIGLFSTSKSVKVKDDFMVFGVSYNFLCGVGFFDNKLDVNTLRPQVVKDLIDSKGIDNKFHGTLRSEFVTKFNKKGANLSFHHSEISNDDPYIVQFDTKHDDHEEPEITVKTKTTIMEDLTLGLMDLELDDELEGILGIDELEAGMNLADMFDGVDLMDFKFLQEDTSKYSFFAPERLWFKLSTIHSQLIVKTKINDFDGITDYMWSMFNTDVGKKSFIHVYQLYVATPSHVQSQEVEFDVDF